MTEQGQTNDTARLRLDKWLWFARFFKTRTRATAACTQKRIQLDGVVVSKANLTIKPGQIVTFEQGSERRVVQVIALGQRRGPAEEAQRLYVELHRISRPHKEKSPALRMRGTGRPTKKQRRQTDSLQQQF